MKISKKIIFLATILIVVSIIAMYFGSVKSIEGATSTLSCPAGTKSTSSTDANGNVTLNCSDTTTTPAPASCTGIVCAAKVSDCSTKKLYSNQTCCAAQASKKTACQP